MPEIRLSEAETSNDNYIGVWNSHEKGLTRHNNDIKTSVTISWVIGTKRREPNTVFLIGKRTQNFDCVKT